MELDGRGAEANGSWKGGGVELEGRGAGWKWKGGCQRVREGSWTGLEG